MARQPRASVSKTSGQGVSRYAYQQQRRKTEGTRVGGTFDSTDEREYAKKASKSEYPGGYDVSFARTRDINDLEDVKALGERKPDKSHVKLAKGKPKKLK